MKILGLYFGRCCDIIKIYNGREGIFLQKTKSRPIDKIRDFFVSPAFMFLPTALAIAGILLGEQMRMPCMIANAWLLALILFLSDDFLAIFMPFMGVMVDGTQYFGKWTDILDYLPWAIPVVIAFAFHFIVYRKPIRFGVSARGNFAVAIAILLGGFGVLSFSDLMSAEGIYHYVMCSAGLFLLYIIFYSNLRTRKRYDIYEHFLWCLFYIGLACSVMVLFYFADYFLSTEKFRAQDYMEILYARNSVAPLLTMALPAPFCFAKKKTGVLSRIFAFLMGLVFYLSLMLTCARTAFVFGTLLFLVCIVYFCYGRKDIVLKVVCLAFLAIAAAVAVRYFGEELWKVVKARLSDGKLISPEEARYKLFFRSLEDFMRLPLFGIGLVSTVNEDICGATEGSLLWYHMYFPQIFGSMGLTGMAAFVYQGIIRLRLCLYRPVLKTVGIALSLLGLFLYSQTDPGEFIPIPFGIMAILMFALLDRYYEDHSVLDDAEKKNWLLFPEK